MIFTTLKIVQSAPKGAESLSILMGCIELQFCYVSHTSLYPFFWAGLKAHPNSGLNKVWSTKNVGLTLISNFNTKSLYVVVLSS